MIHNPRYASLRPLTVNALHWYVTQIFWIVMAGIETAFQTMYFLVAPGRLRRKRRGENDK